MEAQDSPNQIYRQSWLNQIHMVFLFFLASGMVAYLAANFPDVGYFSREYSRLSFDFPIFLLIPVILLFRLIYVVYNERFVLTENYMIFVSGRLSWRERTIRLEYTRIQEIEIMQSILQRLFGIGDIVVIPIAGTEQTNIKMPGLRNPRKVKDEIRSRQHGKPFNY